MSATQNIQLTLSGTAALFWSGGKDSAVALHYVRSLYPGIDIVRLITTITTDYKRISMHGVREELLDRQAAAIGLPLKKMYVPDQPDNKSYEDALARTFRALKAEGINYVVYGDIFLEDLKLYRDTILHQHGLTGIYPLWKRASYQLITDFLQAGFRTVICCVHTGSLDEKYAGAEITEELVAGFPEGVDPCGENGEYHTFCFDGPVFSKPVSFKAGRRVFKPLLVNQSSGASATSGFCYIDLY